MRVTATIRSVEDGVLAECTEYALSCVGATVPLAVAALREALYDRVLRPQAVAPPPTAGQEPIEIVVLDAPTASAERTDDDPMGPGAPPANEVPRGAPERA
jgi:hypothetical protein